MEAPNRIEKEKSELGAKLEGLIEKAKDACERLQEQTTAAARQTDKTIREHPYQAMGIAFGVGVVLGLLVARGRD